MSNRERLPLYDELSILIDRMGSNEELPCTGTNVRSCRQKFAGKFDAKGQPELYFDTGCKAAEQMCPACAAHWHVSVARNLVARARHG